jgi:hypothetical protein
MEDYDLKCLNKINLFEFAIVRCVGNGVNFLHFFMLIINVYMELLHVLSQKDFFFIALG